MNAVPCAAGRGCFRNLEPDAHTLRGRIESVIESLISLLDAIDGDTDQEDLDGDNNASVIAGDGFPGDPDDGEEETDYGAPEDEGVRNAGHNTFTGPGCPIFEGI